VGAVANLVAVYGTLKRGGANHHLLAEGRRSAHVADGYVRGALYDLGPYPALVKGLEPVAVEVYRLLDDRLLDVLDRLEDYRPQDEAASEYVRRRVGVAVSTSGTLDAWVYLFNRPVTRLRPVPGGRWPPPTRSAGS
jgi:gamma-glutamylcyclotransferase (GGCT)/AIG2-like uncharacterized protein YtfP